MKSKRLILALAALFLFVGLLAQAAEAKVQVMFHPRDPTLEKIGEWVQEAHSHIDIIMYNLDVTDRSGFISALNSENVQSRLASGELKIRFIYEGFETGPEKTEKMQALEDLGLDVRFLGRGIKVHHKFAVIDAGLATERVVTGSANWSMSSYRNYNENVLFFDGEGEATYQFQTEFNRVWAASKEFGRALEIEDPVAVERNQRGLDFYFNTERHLKISKPETGLTDEIVRLIESAESDIQIATTRSRLVPVMEALKAAAERGVDVRIVLNQDDYHDLHERAQWLIDVPGIETRVKFFNLNPSNYMAFQMHNKFMIIDHKTVLTGSFNWSKSAEDRHIENLVEFSGAKAREVLPGYEEEFAYLWDLGRGKFTSLQKRFEKSQEDGGLPKCGFPSTVLKVEEIQKLLAQFPKCG